ncbi:MAG: hypothetical protein HZB55_01000 [Deltaproteobacteria bacterium]|nr:hypothetical protein [Deltaproteobacteria bacterium]
MSRKDLVYIVGLVVIAALLLANLFRPTAPAAYELPPGPAGSAAISAAGDAAWVLLGNRVYYLSLRSRADVTNRTITQIDVQELK